MAKASARLGRAGEATDGGRTTAWLLSGVSIAHLLMVLAQAVFAGSFLDGEAGALSAHRTNAELIPWAAALQLIVAGIAARAGGGLRYVIGSAVILAAEVVQIGLGYDGQVALHVPLGVTIFGSSALLTSSSLRRAMLRGTAA